MRNLNKVLKITFYLDILDHNALNLIILYIFVVMIKNIIIYLKKI